ncbi:MAG: glycosyltransferase family 1 protein [Thermoplasmata archaeon]|nr:MAG: glycosyltransferase family 1 protein [Thermoplasmata archaeon]
MKIVHFSWEFFPIIRGGLGTFITELSKMQVKMGNEVTVFAMNERNSFLTLDNWKGVEVHRPKTPDFTSTFYLFADRELQSWGSHFKFFADVISYNVLSAAKLIHLLVRKNHRSYDIVDAHDWLGITSGISVKKELDLPLIFHVHSTEKGRSRGKGSRTIEEIEYAGSEAADCIITVSEAMKDELQKLGFPQNKIRVCWNGVDPQKYNIENISKEDIKTLREQYGVNENEKLLFFIGRLVGVKGVDNLVKAMSSVVEEFPDTKLVILGKGEMAEYIKSLIRENMLDDKVILRAEFVDEKTRILHYAASDLVVLPSLYEPFGIVCTEAMSMSKPVVVGAKGTNGMREQVVPNGEKQCGIHVNPYDPSDIAWGIKQVLGLDDGGVQMGRNARERVLEYFTWEAVAKRTLDIYAEFLK